MANQQAWTPLVIVPASEVNKVENGQETLLAWGTLSVYSVVTRSISGEALGSVWISCGPHLLWEVKPDMPVMKMGHLTYLFSLAPAAAMAGGAPPGQATYYKAVLGSGTPPETLGALEAVLESAAPYAESAKAISSSGAAEAAAAAAAQQRVAADPSSQASAVPPGQMRTTPGNPFAPTGTAGVPSTSAGTGVGTGQAPPGGGPPMNVAAAAAGVAAMGLANGGSTGGGNPFGPGPADTTRPAAGVVPPSGAQYSVEAEIWHRQQPAAAAAAAMPAPAPGPASYGAPPPPTGTMVSPPAPSGPAAMPSGPRPAGPPATGPAAAPTAFVGGPPPSVAARQGVAVRPPANHPSSSSLGHAASAGPAVGASGAGTVPVGGMGGPPPPLSSVGSAPARPAGAGAAAVPVGPYSSKKANKFLAQCDKLSQGVLQKSTSFMQNRRANTEPSPAAAAQEAQGAQGVQGAQPTTSRLTTQVTTGVVSGSKWAANKLAAASAWAGTAMGRKLSSSDPAHPKRAEIADAAGKGVASVFEAMERVCSQLVPAAPAPGAAEAPGGVGTSGGGAAAGGVGGPAAGAGQGVMGGPPTGAPPPGVQHAQQRYPQPGAPGASGNPQTAFSRAPGGPAAVGGHMPAPVKQQAAIQVEGFPAMAPMPGAVIPGPTVEPPPALGMPAVQYQAAGASSDERRRLAKEAAKANLVGYF